MSKDVTGAPPGSPLPDDGKAPLLYAATTFNCLCCDDSLKTALAQLSRKAHFVRCVARRRHPARNHKKSSHAGHGGEPVYPSTAPAQESRGIKKRASPSSESGTTSLRFSDSSQATFTSSQGGGDQLRCRRQGRRCAATDYSPSNESV